MVHYSTIFHTTRLHCEVSISSQLILNLNVTVVYIFYITIVHLVASTPLPAAITAWPSQFSLAPRIQAGCTLLISVQLLAVRPPLTHRGSTGNRILVRSARVHLFTRKTTGELFSVNYLHALPSGNEPRYTVDSVYGVVLDVGRYMRRERACRSFYNITTARDIVAV